MDKSEKIVRTLLDYLK